MTDHPYKHLPDQNYWRRAVSSVDMHQVDPVVSPRFGLDSGTLVATAGSCFAQHIARVLREAGFNYYDAEPAPPEMPSEEAKTRGYGLYSARYGNIYTSRQLLQLVEEAFGERDPDENAWQTLDGRWIDPLRPSIDPAGYDSTRELQKSRSNLLEAVRDIVIKSDVFVFTLGLTEAWRSIRDGSVFPIVPGAAAGEFDPARHEFHNFRTHEVIKDTHDALTKMKARNSNLRCILTVSPVPLVATFEKRHVIVSTTYSKSVLRVAAQELYDLYDWVDYFPSYEIITSSFNHGRYYDDDLRGVNSNGVGHAMRLFMKHYANGGGISATSSSQEYVAAPTVGDGDVLCDEETLDAIST